MKTNLFNVKMAYNYQEDIYKPGTPHHIFPKNQHNRLALGNFKYSKNRHNDTLVKFSNILIDCRREHKLLCKFFSHARQFLISSIQKLLFPRYIIR